MAASLEENNAAELQSLVTPSNFEQIAADLVEAELEKKRLRDERLRASQARSMARMTGEILLSPEVEVSRKAQKKYMDMVQNKYRDRKSQDPKKGDKGNPGNQTKRLNSLHDKHLQMSLNNHTHTIVLTLCENTQQFSCNINGYGDLAKLFLNSHVGRVLVGTFLNFSDTQQDERVTLGKNYKYSGYSSVSEQLVAANLQGITPPPETGDLNNIEFMASTTDEDQSAEAGNYDIQYIPSPLNPLKRAHNAIAHGQAGTLQTNTVVSTPSPRAQPVPNTVMMQREKACTSDVQKTGDQTSPARQEFQKMAKEQAIKVGQQLFSMLLRNGQSDDSKEWSIVQDITNGLIKADTFLAELKNATKRDFTNIPYFLESIEDMLPHLRVALVTKEITIERLSPPLLTDCILMTQDHALASAPTFFRRILERCKKNEQTSQVFEDVQDVMNELCDAKSFIGKINTILDSEIPESELISRNLEIALQYLRSALVKKEITIRGLPPPMLADNILMTQDHAISSGPIFFGRILDRYKKIRQTIKGIHGVQHLINGWTTANDFFNLINADLRLKIEKSESKVENFMIAVQYVRSGLQSKDIVIDHITAPEQEDDDDF